MTHLLKQPNPLSVSVWGFVKSTKITLGEGAIKEFRPVNEQTDEDLGLEFIFPEGTVWELNSGDRYAFGVGGKAFDMIASVRYLAKQDKQKKK